MYQLDPVSPTHFNDYILTKSVSVEAIGCEQLAQSRLAVDRTHTTS